MGRYEISYISPGGREWKFTDSEWAAGIKHDGISGLVGDVTDIVHTPVGSEVQFVESQNPLPMEGSLTLHIQAHGGKSAAEVWADFRKDFSRSKQGTLSITSPAGVVSCRVRLSTTLSPPKKDPDFDEVVLNVEVPLVADRTGWWFAPVVRPAGVVQVANSGDLMLYPSITWTSAGAVAMPSGATFQLPTVAASRTVQLVHGGVGKVTDANGVLDKPLRLTLSKFPSEGVPAGETRSYTIPTGATLTYQIGVLDPWL